MTETPRNRWITSDWHLGEDRFAIMNRHGFKDAQDMVDQFAKFHNELVGEDDLVYFLGDAVNQKTPEFLEQVSKFNGRKILFRGNHDRVFTDAALEEFFFEIIQERDGLPVTLDMGDEEDLECWLQHYPTESRSDLFNLVGHIHSAWKVQLNMINVGVDVNHYRPFNLDKDIPFMFKAIRDFYDNDVHVGHHPANIPFVGNRGKDGRYLDVDGLVGG